MEQFYRDAARLFRDYKQFCKQQHDDYEKQATSKMYSKGYLRNLQQENNQKRQQERSKIINRMSKIREEYNSALIEKYDLERGSVSSKLQCILTSGINLTESELLRLAEKHKNSLIDSRLLHDYAESKGYTLRNYITLEECLQNFDNLTHHIRNSMDENNILPMFVTPDDCEMAAGSYYSKCVKPEMEIFKTPETPEECILQDMADQKKVDSGIDDRAFVEGFTGKKQEKPSPGDELTTLEREIAENHSVYAGRGSEISQEDVEFALKSSKETSEEANEDAIYKGEA